MSKKLQYQRYSDLFLLKHLIKPKQFDCLRTSLNGVKGKVMQIDKQLINDRLPVSNISKFRIPTIYNFAVIYP